MREVGLECIGTVKYKSMKVMDESFSNRLSEMGIESGDVKYKDG